MFILAEYLFQLEFSKMENWEWQHKLENIKFEWCQLAAKKQEGRKLTEEEEKREAYLRRIIMLFV